MLKTSSGTAYVGNSTPRSSINALRKTIFIFFSPRHLLRTSTNTPNTIIQGSFFHTRINQHCCTFLSFFFILLIICYTLQSKTQTHHWLQTYRNITQAHTKDSPFFPSAQCRTKKPAPKQKSATMLATLCCRGPILRKPLLHHKILPQDTRPLVRGWQANTTGMFCNKPLH